MATRRRVTYAAAGCIVLSLVIALSPPPAAAGEEDWSDTFLLQATGFENPLVRVGFNPCPEPPALNLRNPTTPVISVPGAANPFELRFAIQGTEGAAPMTIRAAGRPDLSGQYRFQVVNARTGDSFFDVFIQLGTDSEGGIRNWSSTSDEAPPFPGGPYADLPVAIVFSFEFTSLSTASLSLGISGPSGDLLSFSQYGAPQKVVIDIKPGDAPNTINPRSKGVIPVAILTTRTADGDPLDFDATTVDPSTVAFGPGRASEAHKKGHIADVDRDGDLDLMLHFRTQDTGIASGDTEAGLTGQTYGGQEIVGADAIRTVGKARKPAVALLDGYHLGTSFPNPANPAATIAYALPEDGEVSLVVYNVMGQEVRTLVNAMHFAGRYSVVWDGRDDLGRRVSSGVYLYRFVSEGFVETRRMMLLK